MIDYEKVWRLAIEPDIDLEFERVLEMSDDEIRASLASRGHDLRILEAQAMIAMGLPRKRNHRRGFIQAGAAILASAVTTGTMIAAATQWATPVLSAAFATAHPTGAAPAHPIGAAPAATGAGPNSDGGK